MKLGSKMKVVAAAIALTVGINAATPRKAEAGYIFVIAGALTALNKLVPGLLAIAGGAGLIIVGKAIKRGNPDIKIVGTILVILNDKNTDRATALSQSIEQYFPELSQNSINNLASAVAAKPMIPSSEANIFKPIGLTEAEVLNAVKNDNLSAEVLAELVEYSKAI